VVMLALFWSGMTINDLQLVAVLEQRPLFFGLSITLGIVLAFVTHLFVRRIVIKNILEKNQGLLMPGMSLSRALQLNTRNRHSIFRPEPVGWNFFQKKRLSSTAAKVDKLRQKMVDVIEKYPAHKKVAE